MEDRDRVLSSCQLFVSSHEILNVREDKRSFGRVFREDGIGLRDEYKISGPELETMCDIARTVPGVLGERMLGGGDKGAAGALVRADSVDALRQAVDVAYPRSHPDFADSYAVHVCRVVDGVKVLEFDGTADGATWLYWDGSNAWSSAGGDHDPAAVADSPITDATGDWESAEQSFRDAVGS